MEISPRTVIRMLELIDRVNATVEGGARRNAERTRGPYVEGEAGWTFWSRTLFEHNIPDWIVQHAESHYHYDWDRLLKAFHSGQFFVTEYGPIASERECPREAYGPMGEAVLGVIAAILVNDDFGPKGPLSGQLKTEPLVRALEHDGFRVDRANVRLIPVEGHVSHEEEESRLANLIDNSGLANRNVSNTHLKDASDHYIDGTKDHSSLGESRSLLQSLLDGISEAIDQRGISPVGLPGGTSNRLDYLERNGLLTADERTAFGAAWGFLSAGTHPGLPPREQARMGILLSIEFSQMLVLKWLDWCQRHP